MRTAYLLCKHNLERAEMLPYIHVITISNSELELEFALGQRDRDQWEVGRGK